MIVCVRTSVRMRVCVCGVCSEGRALTLTSAINHTRDRELQRQVGTHRSRTRACRSTAFSTASATPHRTGSSPESLHSCKSEADTLIHTHTHELPLTRAHTHTRSHQPTHPHTHARTLTQRATATSGTHRSRTRACRSTAFSTASATPHPIGSSPESLHSCSAASAHACPRCSRVHMHLLYFLVVYATSRIRDMQVCFHYILHAFMRTDRS